MHFYDGFRCLERNPKRLHGDPRLVLQVLLMILVGLPFRDTLDLRWIDIDFDRNTVETRDCKSGFIREMSLPVQLKVRLMLWKQDQHDLAEDHAWIGFALANPETAYVFMDERGRLRGRELRLHVLRLLDVLSAHALPSLSEGREAKR